MLIVVWIKLWVFGIQGPPPLPLFMNYLEEGLYRSFLEGVIFVSLVTLTDTSAELCILGDVGVSCHSSTDIE